MSDVSPPPAAAPTPPAPPPDAAPAEPAALLRAAPAEPTPTRAASGGPRRGRIVGRLIALSILLGGAGAGAWVALDWWRVGRFFVSTDDAYVKADTATISAKVSGYVAEIAVADHQAVKAGDVLLRIDDGDYRLAARAAVDRIATQDASIARIGAQIAAQRASVAQAEAQIAAAQADRARADAAFQRTSTLARHDFASQAQFDQAQADQKRAAASLDAAKAARLAASEAVAVLEAQKLEAARQRGELETAKARAERDLSFATLTAPFDGVVGARAAQQGQLVQPGQRLMALLPLDHVYVEANFKETQIARLRPGQKVEIEVDAFEGRRIEGEVASLAPATGAQFSLLPPDNATGNFTKIVQRVPVRLSIPAEIARRGELRPGLSVTARVDTRAAAPQTPPAAPAPPAVSDAGKTLFARARDWAQAHLPAR